MPLTKSGLLSYANVTRCPSQDNRETTRNENLDLHRACRACFSTVRAQVKQDAGRAARFQDRDPGSAGPPVGLAAES